MHILPLRNVLHTDETKSITQRSNQYYLQKKAILAEDYQVNADYFNFLDKNDYHSKINSVTIESLPKENYEYIKLAKNKNSANELNKLSQVEIEYIFYLKMAVTAKLNQEFHGDPIIHPFVYKKTHRSDRHIVMGDEYSKWQSAGDIF